MRGSFHSNGVKAENHIKPALEIPANYGVECIVTIGCAEEEKKACGEDEPLHGKYMSTASDPSVWRCSMKGVICLLLLSMEAMAHLTAVPSDQDPKHQTVFRNDHLLVLHVALKPGESTDAHTHSRDSMAVELTKTQIQVQEPGKQPNPPRQVSPGDIIAHDYARQPFTHKVTNVGQANFDVLDIELLKRPAGPETKPAAPVAAENAGMRAYRWEIEPGASSSRHAHQCPSLIIAATPMELTMASPDGQSITHPVKAGDIQWVDRAVTHTLTNSGRERGIIVEVELK